MDKGYTLGMTKIRDKIYCSPSIGRATTGHSILVTNTANQILYWLYKNSEQFRSIPQQICNFYNLQNGNYKLKLRFGSRTLEIMDDISKTILVIYPDLIKTIK